MNYSKPSFTVPAGSRAPETCDHGTKGGNEPWTDPRGRCVTCGDRVRPLAMIDGGVTEQEWAASMGFRTR